MESVCRFKLGFSLLIKSVSKTKQSNLLWHFLRILKRLSLIQKIAATARFSEMLANSRIFVFSNALEKVSGCVTDHMRNDKQRIADSQLLNSEMSINIKVWHILT